MTCRLQELVNNGLCQQNFILTTKCVSYKKLGTIQIHFDIDSEELVGR